jgi:hypothetical protein
MPLSHSIFADPGRMGHCLFKPRRIRLGNEQHRQTRPIHHEQACSRLGIDSAYAKKDNKEESFKR